MNAKLEKIKDEIAGLTTELAKAKGCTECVAFKKKGYVDLDTDPQTCPTCGGMRYFTFNVSDKPINAAGPSGRKE